MNTRDTLKEAITKNDNDFKLIYNELKRQYDTLLKFDDSHDLKAGVFLGFIVVIIAQITLSNDYINTVTKSLVSLIPFLIGFISIFLSFIFGLRAIYIREYAIGPNIPILYNQWYEGKQGKKFNRAIFSDIYQSYKRNNIAKEEKITLIRKMFLTFAFGIVFIILSRIAIMVF